MSSTTESVTRRGVTPVPVGLPADRDSARSGRKARWRDARVAARLRRTLLSSQLILLVIAPIATAGTSRVFGSAGLETRITPPSLHSPLNPDNVAGVARNTNLFDATLFLDRTSDDRRWKLRLKLRGEANDRSSDTVRLAEAITEFGVRPWLTLAAGRSIEKWGTGYAWNPTAFLSQPKDPSDAADRRSVLAGRDLVRADISWSGSNLTLYALRDRAVAARFYRWIRQTDVAANLYAARGDARAGMSVSRVFGERLEVHGEAAMRRRKGPADGRTIESVVGGQITFPRGVNLVVEWNHSGSGLSAAQWASVRALAVAGELQRANAAYAPLRMARDYGFVRLAVPIGRTEVEALVIVNVRDGSALERLAVTRRVGSRLSIYLIQTEFTGNDGSELSWVQIERSTVTGVRLHF